MKTIEQFTSEQFGKLPDILSTGNIDLFKNVLHRVDKWCTNHPNAYRLVMPFHKLTFGWQSAYASGFTWEDFLKDIINANYINVRKVLNNSHPYIIFCNNSNEAGFSADLVHED